MSIFVIGLSARLIQFQIYGKFDVEKHRGTIRMSVFVVSAHSCGQIILEKTAVRSEGTFEDLFNVAMRQKNLSFDSVKKINIRPQPGSPPILVSLDMDLSVLSELSCKFVDFEVERKIPSDKNNNICMEFDSGPSKSNAFSLMMGAQKKFELPKKPKSNEHGKLIGPDKLLSDLIDLAFSLECGWTSDSLDTGTFVLTKLRNALWYIDHYHKRLHDSGCNIPQLFQSFNGYNNFAKNHHRVPSVTSEKLDAICADLAKALSFPSMQTRRNKVLYDNIESLLKCLVKYKEKLNKDNDRHKSIYHKQTEPTPSLEKDSETKYIHSKSAVHEQYELLDSAVNRLGWKQYIDLDDFSPADRIKRRKYVNDLGLSCPVMLFRIAYGGAIGTLNFVWRTSEESVEQSELNTKIIAKITSTLPKYSSRAVRRDFINKYSQYVKAPKAVLRHMFSDLTGFEVKDENYEQNEINERISDILLGSDDPELLLDYRKLNGKEMDQKFDTFFNEVGKYFDEQLMQVHERRHGQELYLPLAISIEDLRSEIIKRIPPDASVPSAETLRLQFMPNNAFQKTAMKYTGIFDVNFRVQTRQARVFHPDARFVSTYFKYLKHFCVRFRKFTNFVCLDDKAVIPVGEPGCPISTGVRGHNKALAPSAGPQLVAADHDFHIAGLVPSVALVTSIPSNKDDSFFQGKIYVTTKDKVFQASSPARHATELTKILREHFSDDDVNLKMPVLCLMTDGGPDHRLTFESVKLSLVQLFMQLDLDMIVAIRTAPNHSWVNPAERCMAILNLALQHVALERSEMEGKFEKAVKNKSSLGAIRNLAEYKEGFQAAFKGSIDPIIEKVNNRFSRMKLKGENIVVYKGVSNEEIDSSLEVVQQALGLQQMDVSSKMNSKDLRKVKRLQEFIKLHSKSSHYGFQLQKCGECAYCILNPVRLPDDVFHDLHFLPDPMPDETGQHYKTFDQLFGTETTDKHRPSANLESAEVEEDKINRDVFKAGKCRDIIICGECAKPRCVYSHNKMTQEQDLILHRTKEEQIYTCGDSLPADSGLFVRASLGCNSDVEITYYSAPLRHFAPPCCVYCGSSEDLMSDMDEYIQNLYQQFSVVRPLCIHCKESGKEAKTWGKNFFAKKQRK